MSKKHYRLTDQATVEMRRMYPAGKIVLSERAARHELRRGTIELDGVKATPAVEKPAAG
jgi:hypothetical protein